MKHSKESEKGKRIYTRIKKEQIKVKWNTFLHVCGNSKQFSLCFISTSDICAKEWCCVFTFKGGTLASRV